MVVLGFQERGVKKVKMAAVSRPNFMGTVSLMQIKKIASQTQSISKLQKGFAM